MTARRVTDVYRITTGDGRSTEELVAAGEYGYAHSCLISENFPARHPEALRVREIVLLEFDHDVTTEQTIVAAVEAGLERPMYEDALYFGIEHPHVQRPIIFLHDPWIGYFGRRDVICLWSNAGRRAGSRGIRRQVEPQLAFRVCPDAGGWRSERMSERDGSIGH
jgi:hypothetical protein